MLFAKVGRCPQNQIFQENLAWPPFPNRVTWGAPDCHDVWTPGACLSTELNDFSAPSLGVLSQLTTALSRCCPVALEATEGKNMGIMH